MKALPDYLKPGMGILFVGINPGIRSQAVGHHFAGHSNRFWKLLYASGLVDESLTYRDDWRLPEWGLGITNIIARASAGIDTLDPQEYRRGRLILERKIAKHQPKLVALLGITIFRLLFERGRSSLGIASLGLTTELLAEVPVYLLPNPSGRNAHYPYPLMLAAYRRLREQTGR